MKFFVWWTGADGRKVESGPHSLANATESALDFRERGTFLYIIDDTGKRLTLETAEQLRASSDVQKQTNRKRRTD